MNVTSSTSVAFLRWGALFLLVQCKIRTFAAIQQHWENHVRWYIAPHEINRTLTNVYNVYSERLNVDTRFSEVQELIGPSSYRPLGTKPGLFLRLYLRGAADRSWARRACNTTIGEEQKMFSEEAHPSTPRHYCIMEPAHGRMVRSSSGIYFNPRAPENDLFEAVWRQRNHFQCLACLQRGQEEEEEARVWDVTINTFQLSTF